MSFSPLDPAKDDDAKSSETPHPRKPWSTPMVIVSELRLSGAQVGVGSDGTSPTFGYAYGS